MNTISILLLEDCISICDEFKKHISVKDSMDLVNVTNSSLDAIKLVKIHKPDSVIVDLELTDGTGSGIDFLEKLKEFDLGYMPYIAVNTNVRSELTYEAIHDGFADIIFWKQQQGYSIDYVLNAISFSVKRYKNRRKEDSSEMHSMSIDDKRIHKFISDELNTLGIKSNHKGRTYLFEAIKFNLEKFTVGYRSPLKHVGNLYNMKPSHVCRDISTAIKYAWLHTPLDVLDEHYQGTYSKDSGFPTPMEFISYYTEKIKCKL